MERLTLSERIREAIAAAGLSQSDVARRTGNTTGAVSQWISGQTRQLKTHNALALEALTGYRAQWLATGAGPRMADHASVVRGSDGERQLPLLAGHQVDLWLDETSPFEPEDWLTTEGIVGEKAFGLKVEGRSMTPKFEPGDKVIIDPEVTPIPGDYVALHTDQGLQFRRYRVVAANPGQPPVFEAVAVNPDYPALRSDIAPLKILGTMVEHRTYRRT